MITSGLAMVLAGWRDRGWRADLDHPDVLVQSGAHRVTRNPMYVGMALVHLGTASATRSVWLALTWGMAMPAIHRVIVAEEQSLATRFGPAYDRYRRDVPRYLVQRGGDQRPP